MFCNLVRILHLTKRLWNRSAPLLSVSAPGLGKRGVFASSS